MAILLMSKTTNETCVEQEFFQVAGVPQILAYIPSKTDNTRKYFSIVQSHYLSLGVKEVRYCDLDKEFSSNTLNSIRSSDVIYLAGGFTPYFLEVIHLRQVAPLIRDFSLSKSVIGVSAGALILGQNISILFEDPSEGSAAKALANINGIGLYDFEFWPHFGRFETDEIQMMKRSVINKNLQIIGCDDFSGLIVANNYIRTVGSAHFFFRGKYQIYRDQPMTSEP
jgi:peptidase E